MFKKIISNLPFNPTLADQANFYIGRLKQESGVRKLGFLFICLSFSVQLLAVMYPPQNSLAASPNDVLSGITNKNYILNAWDSNSGNIRTIYGKFGITRQNIADIPGQQPNATVISTSANWWSVGRLPLSYYGISGKEAGERTIDLGTKDIYQRPLRAWDTGGSSTYLAFHGTNQYGVDFWLLKSCGNPTFKGPYLPKPPKPNLEIHKTRLSAKDVTPGEKVKFLLEYRNTVKDSLATNLKVTDELDNDFEFISLEDMTSHSGNRLTILKSHETGYSDKDHAMTSTLTVRVKPSVKQPETICNQAFIDSDDTARVPSERVCVVVKIPPKAPTTPIAPTQPVAPESPSSGYCLSTSSVASANSVSIQTTAYTENASVNAYLYDIDGNGSIDYTDNTHEASHQRVINNLNSGSHSFLVYIQMTNKDGSNLLSSACPTDVAINETPRVVLSKSVSNITQNISDSNNTTVKSGDIIEFKLTTKNVTSSDYSSYQGNDYFGDVLQYAELVNPSQLNQQGITLGSDNYLRWSSSVIKANESETKTIQVKIKDIIPTTNSPSNVSPDYDCRISNNYGNEVLMNVECPIVKEVAQNATSLPNTGPGTTVIAGFIVTTIAGYFFARTKLMSKELDLIRNSLTK